MLKRKHARICLLLLLLAVVFVCMPFAAHRILDVDTGFWVQLGYIGTVVCAGLAVLKKINCLRCPCCGQGTAALHWNAGRDGCCARCGKPFVFDDELSGGGAGHDQ